MTKTPNGQLQPVLTPGEAWHLARMDAFAKAAEYLKRATRKSGELDKAAVEQVRREFEQRAAAYLDAYYATTGKASLGATAPAVYYEDTLRMPVIVREQPTKGGWGTVDLHDEKGGEAMVLATPFREVNLSTLPAGTRFIQFRNPEHAALAVVVEILKCMRLNLQAAAVATDEADALYRSGNLVMTYLCAAQAGISVLEDDDFATWQKTVPSVSDITAAPGALAKVATKVRPMCAIGLHLCAEWLDGLAKAAAQRPPGQRFQHTVVAVDDALAKLGPLLDSINGFLSGADTARFDHMPVVRHGQGTVPILAVIPRAADAPTPIRQSGGEKKAVKSR